MPTPMMIASTCADNPDDSDAEVGFAVDALGPCGFGGGVRGPGGGVLGTGGGVSEPGAFVGAIDFVGVFVGDCVVGADVGDFVGVSDGPDQIPRTGSQP